jgi:hypothetical protein
MPTERNRQILYPRVSSFDVVNPHAGRIIPGFLPRSPIQPSHLNSDNYSIDFLERGVRSDVASSVASEEGCSNYDLLSMNRDDDLEATSVHEPHLGFQSSVPACDPVHFNRLMLAS